MSGNYRRQKPDTARHRLMIALNIPLSKSSFATEFIGEFAIATSVWILLIYQGLLGAVGNLPGQQTFVIGFVRDSRIDSAAGQFVFWGQCILASLMAPSFVVGAVSGE